MKRREWKREPTGLGWKAVIPAFLEEHPFVTNAQMAGLFGISRDHVAFHAGPWRSKKRRALAEKLGLTA